MSEIRLLHAADLHLDWSFPGFGLDESGAQLRRDELRQTLALVMEKARGFGAHVVLFAGDLFEQAYLCRSTVQFANDLFAAAAPIRIFLLPGRRDPATPTSYYRLFPWAPNVHVFGPEWERVDLDALGASIYGMGWAGEEAGPTEADLQPVTDPARLNLALLHGEFAPEALRRMGADYVALGGRHQAASVLAPEGRPLGQYPGSPSPVTWQEQGERTVIMGAVTKEGARLWLEPTGSREVVEVALDLSGARRDEDLVSALLHADAEPRRQRHLYRVTLTGMIHPDLRPDLPALMERLAADYHVLTLIDQTQPDYDFARLSRERSARGQFVVRMLSLQQQATDPATTAWVRRALVLGIRAFERGGAR